jgi:hypothetical protein
MTGFICFPLYDVDVPAWPTSHDALQYLGVWGQLLNVRDRDGLLSRFLHLRLFGRKVWHL